MPLKGEQEREANLLSVHLEVEDSVSSIYSCVSETQGSESQGHLINSKLKATVGLMTG